MELEDILSEWLRYVATFVVMLCCLTIIEHHCGDVDFSVSVLIGQLLRALYERGLCIASNVRNGAEATL